MKMVKLSDNQYIRADLIDSIFIAKNSDEVGRGYLVTLDTDTDYLYPFSGTEAECIDYVKDLAMQINDG